MQNYNENDILNIIKECYWDYNISKDDIINIVNSDDLRLKLKLFSKIINNSTNRVKHLQIFKEEDLTYLFNAFKQKYNNPSIRDHILALRNIFLNENNVIEKLIWKKR